MIDFKALAAEFPRDAVSWRCQTVSKNGDKGLALAYIDARDVMRRLDEVCSPAGWQDRYEVHGPKTICYLSLRIGDEWITKADGAGDSDVEAEKGAISDAFKRSAVKWGVGRYLYDVPAPWAPCESYDAGGKKRWSKWIGDPWDHVRKPAPIRQVTSRPAGPELYNALEHAITNAETDKALADVLKARDAEIHALSEADQAALRRVYAVKREALRVFGEAA